MRMSMGLQARQLQTQKLAPRMIQSMEILQLPILALQERIDQELEENPILTDRAVHDLNIGFGEEFHLFRRDLGDVNRLQSRAEQAHIVEMVNARCPVAALVLFKLGGVLVQVDVDIGVQFL